MVKTWRPLEYLSLIRPKVVQITAYRTAMGSIEIFTVLHAYLIEIILYTRPPHQKLTILGDLDRDF